jgi:hypothetical protein
MGDNYISFYEGGYSSLSPESGNYVGFRMNAGQLASTTSPMTANQLNETISRIKEGVQNVEIELVSPDIAEGVPKQQFQEMHALMKLTGVKPSVHAPVIDPSGFGQQGFNENEREETERRFMDVLEKTHVLDPNGNLPVVFHSSNSGGPTYKPEGKEGSKDRFHVIQEAIVNKDTGQIQGVKEKRVYYHEDPDSLDPNKPLNQQGKVFSVESAIRSANQSEWDNKIRETAMLQKEVEENISKAMNFRGSGTNLPEINSEADNYLSRSQIFLQDAELSFRGIFDKTYEHGSDEQRKKIKKLADQWKVEEREIAKKMKDENYEQVIDFKNKLLNKRLREFRNEIEPAEDHKTGKKINPEGLPKIFTSAQDFATEKASETFGNIAWKAYDKWKDKAPIIAIENLYPGMGFSRAEDLKKLIEESRKKFEKKAISKGMSKSEAEKKAEKLIGATWDVGHLNIHKKHGFTDKDLAEETKKIAKLAKHVHLTDNFGFGDSHLGVGMGNAPIKEHLKILEKQGNFKEMRKVIEAGGLVDPNKGLKMNPLRATLGAFGSQVQGGENPIYWNQAENMQGNYFGFPMAYMPEKHFSMYGSGFSTLPEELGGQVPGSQSRFSGTPNS